MLTEADVDHRAVIRRALGTPPEDLAAPTGLARADGERRIGAVTLEEWSFTNGLGESVPVTCVVPDEVRHAVPVIALHETSDAGRHALVEEGAHARLAFGLAFARAGFRVWAPELAFTAERVGGTAWNTAPFYERHPEWSALGKELHDITGLVDAITRDATDRVVAVGHSQGGLYASVAAALDDRIGAVVANAGYMALSDRRDGSIAPFNLFNPASRFRHAGMPGELPARALEQAARSATILLVCHRFDHLLRGAIPDVATRGRLERAGVAVVVETAVHGFRPSTQALAARFAAAWDADRAIDARAWVAAHWREDDDDLRDEIEHGSRLLRRAMAKLDETEHQRHAAERAYASVVGTPPATPSADVDDDTVIDELRSEIESLRQRVRELHEEVESRSGIRAGAREFVRGVRRKIRGPEWRGDAEFTAPWRRIDSSQLPALPGPRVLVLSHMFPHPAQVGSGPFVHEQVKALRDDLGVDARVLVGRPFWLSPVRSPIALARGWSHYRRVRDERTWYDLDGVPVRYVYWPLVRGSRRHGPSYREGIVRALEQEADFAYDLVHAHTSYYDGGAALAAAARRGVPMIITEHTGPFSMITRRPSMRAHTEAALAGADRIVPVSRAQARDMTPHIEPAHRDRIVVLPNGVDPEVFFPPDARTPDPGAPRLLFVGHLVPGKNIPLLLEAMRSIRGARPRATLTIVGKGETPEDDAELRRQAQQLGLADAVRFTGAKPRTEVARIMREDADLLVLPSASETFGCVLIEALATGMPVVSTTCGGPEDIVTDDAYGRLCPPGALHELITALENVIERLPAYDPERIRAYAVDAFGYASLARALRRLYAEVLER